RRRHTSFSRDWSSDVCSSDLAAPRGVAGDIVRQAHDDVAKIERVEPAEAVAAVGSAVGRLEREAVDTLVKGQRHYLQVLVRLAQIGRASCRGRGLSYAVAAGR